MNFSEMTLAQLFAAADEIQVEGYQPPTEESVEEIDLGELFAKADLLMSEPDVWAIKEECSTPTFEEIEETLAGLEL